LPWGWIITPFQRCAAQLNHRSRLLWRQDIKIKQLIAQTDPQNEQQIYTLLTEDNRMFVGGIDDQQWKWMELPPPTEKNTKWLGGPLESPFRPPQGTKFHEQ